MGNIFYIQKPVTFKDLANDLSKISEIENIDFDFFKQKIINICYETFDKTKANKFNIVQINKKLTDVLSIPKIKSTKNDISNKNSQIREILKTETNIITDNIEIIIDYLNYIDFDVNLTSKCYKNKENSSVFDIELEIMIPRLEYNSFRWIKDCEKLFAKKNKFNFNVIFNFFPHNEKSKLKFNSLGMLHLNHCTCRYDDEFSIGCFSVVKYVTINDAFIWKFTDYTSFIPDDENYFNIFSENIFNMFKSIN